MTNATNATSQTTTTAKSRGHLAFFGKFEYFTARGKVYSAYTFKPVMMDGYRCGRFECYEGRWEDFREMLLRNFPEFQDQTS